MDVLAGQTDVSTYFVLRLAADGTEATGLTITNFDLQYVRSGEAPAAKVDATALAATNSAHGDNQAIEIDATDQPGLYRVDWPDAAFATGVREVILTVKCATAFTEHLRVNLTPQPANVTQFGGSAGTFSGGRPEVNTSHAAGTAWNSGAIGASTLASDTITAAKIASDAITAAKIAGDAITAAKIADGAIDAATFAAGAITATVIATGAIDADAIAADAVTEIQSGLSTLDAAGVRTAVGLAGANLDTQLSAIDDFLDTEIAAIKAKTDNLPADPADASDVAASFTTVNTKLDTIDDFLDTEVAAIKAKTDNLPSDPADASDVASSFTTVNTTLATIAGYLDTEIAAIKAKTDNLPASPAATGDIPTVSQIWTTALTEAYRATGATGTAAQLLYEILQNITGFSISGTTKTAKKLDGSTTAKTYTLDSSTTPTSITETT